MQYQSSLDLRVAASLRCVPCVCQKRSYFDFPIPLYFIFLFPFQEHIICLWIFNGNLCERWAGFWLYLSCKYSELYGIIEGNLLISALILELYFAATWKCCKKFHHTIFDSIACERNIKKFYDNFELQAFYNKGNLLLKVYFLYIVIGHWNRTLWNSCETAITFFHEKKGKYWSI